jgi:hypothetical protein
VLFFSKCRVNISSYFIKIAMTNLNIFSNIKGKGNCFLPKVNQFHKKMCAQNPTKLIRQGNSYQSVLFALGLVPVSVIGTTKYKKIFLFTYRY